MPYQFTDEAAAVAEITRLTADLATANTSLTTITGERDKARTDLATANTSITTLTTERDTAKAEVTRLKGENDKLTNDMKDFNARVAAEVAKKGIRSTAAETGTDNKAKEGEKLTATEKVLAAKGAASLADLGK